MSISYKIDRVAHLSPEEFVAGYVRHRRPVLISKGFEGCAARHVWSLDHLRRRAGERRIVLKDWDESGIRLSHVRLDAYVDSLERYEAGDDEEAASRRRPPYLHDVPLTSILADAAADLEQFPCGFFPAWYGADWPKFAQLFLGPSGSVTPLHFDCLLTHNLFFQVMGRKKFTLLPYKQLVYCYPRDWRWCAVDVENPDYDRHPLFRSASPVEVVVEPGDVLYMPPGALHHVRSLDCGLSFNVDWHTKESALRGALAFARGMPMKNVYYNSVIAFGMWTGVAARVLFPYYRSYLDYVS
ncbi:MAG: transcription factor jumonji [Methylocystaceae bacterium]|nr:MAG: transcription factor jumonji [Methylocystaceae bacterium]